MSGKACSCRGGAKFDMWQTTSRQFHRNFHGDPEEFPQTEHKLAPGNQLISYIDENKFPKNRLPKEMPASTFKTSNDLNVDTELAHLLNDVKHVSDVRIGILQRAAENVKKSANLTEDGKPMETTSKTTHRFFSQAETAVYPPNNATYWTCEEYPKGWGFGVLDNPLPKIAPHERGIDMNRDPKINLQDGHVSKLTVEIPTDAHPQEKITTAAPWSGPALPKTKNLMGKYTKIPSVKIP